MKNKRIKMLKECLNKINEIQGFYIAVSPAWILIQTAKGHLTSVHHLEAETKFDEETLGVKDE
jgi:hypothetical protein